MKKIALQCLSLLIIALASLSGCGGGGGGDSSQVPAAVLTISSQGTLPAGTTLSGAEITVKFPSSVTVKTDGPGVVNSSVVVPSGVTAGQASTLIDPLVPGEITFLLVSTAPGGFGAGEFVKLYFTIVPGSTPQATDFVLSGFTPVRLVGDGNAVAALGVTSTLEIR